MKIILQGLTSSRLVTQGYVSYLWTAPTYPLSAARAESRYSAALADSRLTARRS